jgi:vacuolar-type H+-ATPase subunit F/Vma7
MRPPIFIGDEVSAVGFRLAGAQVTILEGQDPVAAFDQACAAADLVLISAEAAERIPAADLRAALRRGQPLVLVVPDVRGHAAPPDLGAGLRRQLGLGE